MSTGRMAIFITQTLAAVTVIAGCTTTTTQSFRSVDAPNVDAAFVATDVDFSKYRRLMAEDMGIFFPRNTPMSSEELQRLRQIFRTAFLEELTDYDIVTEASPDTMAVQASLIDLRKARYVDVPNLRSEIRDIATPGELIFLMEFRDSKTSRVLARAADSTETPTFASEGEETDWASVQAAAERWASLFRNFLDNNLAR